MTPTCSHDSETTRTVLIRQVAQWMAEVATPHADGTEPVEAAMTAATALHDDVYELHMEALRADLAAARANQVAYAAARRELHALNKAMARKNRTLERLRAAVAEWKLAAHEPDIVDHRCLRPGAFVVVHTPGRADSAVGKVVQHAAALVVELPTERIPGDGHHDGHVAVVAKLREIADQYPADVFTDGGRTPDGIAGTAIRERMLAEIRHMTSLLGGDVG